LHSTYGTEPALLAECFAPGCRYAWDNAAGKLSTTFAAQAEKAIGSFSSRASNPVVQAVSTDAQEAVIWEVRASCASDLLRPEEAASWRIGLEARSRSGVDIHMANGIQTAQPVSTTVKLCQA